MISWKERAARSLHRRGIGGTLRLVPGLMLALIKGNPDLRFDRRFRVDTAGILKPGALMSDPRYRNSNGYAPCLESRFVRMLSDVPADCRDFVFIDFGCGKGKALLLASRLPFRQIIGVELWPDLVKVAEENLRRYTGRQECRSIQIHCIDAADYAIPADPGVYYFFDPFRAQVTLKVLDNIRRSLEAHPRPVYVIYSEPERPDLLDGAGFLDLLKRTPHYSIYRSAHG